MSRLEKGVAKVRLIVGSVGDVGSSEFGLDETFSEVCHDLFKATPPSITNTDPGSANQTLRTDYCWCTLILIPRAATSSCIHLWIVSPVRQVVFVLLVSSTGAANGGANLPPSTQKGKDQVGGCPHEAITTCLRLDGIGRMKSSEAAGEVGDCDAVPLLESARVYLL